MGQTAAETKREIDETRAQLDQTLAALQLKAQHALDWRTQVRTSPGFRLAVVVVAAGLVALVGFFGPSRPLRRLLPERPERRPRRQRDAVPRQPPSQRAGTTLSRRAAEAAVSALAAGLVKMAIERANTRARASRLPAPVRPTPEAVKV
jgi:hypothetical protein